MDIARGELIIITSGYEETHGVDGLFIALEAFNWEKMVRRWALDTKRKEAPSIRSGRVCFDDDPRRIGPPTTLGDHNAGPITEYRYYGLIEWVLSTRLIAPHKRHNIHLGDYGVVEIEV